MTSREKAERIHSLYRDLRNYSESMQDGFAEGCDAIEQRNPDIGAYWRIVCRGIATPDILIRMVEAIIEGKGDLSG